MFTGIIEAVGRIERVEKKPRLHALTISSRLGRLRPGHSVALDGVCLTVVGSSKKTFVVQAAEETLRLTNVGSWAKGRTVNLERPLKTGSELGGHFVQGHVDGVAVVDRVQHAAEGSLVVVRAPRSLLKYVAAKGSVALDGVSLTVNEIRLGSFSVFLVPFTLRHTTFSTLHAGRAVHIEVDILSKYVRRLMEQTWTRPQGLNQTFRPRRMDRIRA